MTDTSGTTGTYALANEANCSVPGSGHYLACRCREQGFSRLRLSLERISMQLDDVPEGGTLDWSQIAYLRAKVREALG